ncbi:MAG: M23 family metallopeptidase [Saprospiraceae bacterium]
MSNTDWCFWQWGAQTDECEDPGTHCIGAGIGDADDTYAWDANLSNNLDDGLPVYAVANGEVIYTGGWGGNTYGQLLIKHTLPNGNHWYSGYMHLENKTSNSCVKVGDIVGYISNTCSTCSPPLPDHLHFAVYKK